MRKWDLALLTLLIFCLGLNFFIWQEVKDIKNNQMDVARRDQVDRIGLSVSEAVQTLEVFAKEQKWVQESYFLLDKEKSGTNTMIVQARFTFSTMEQNHIPYFLLREKGSKDWVEFELEHKQLLDYTIDLNLSPLAEYEYQIITYGDKKKTSDVRLIPYNLYGVPKWKEEIKAITGNSGDIEFVIKVFMIQSSSLPDMEPKNVTLKLEAYGKELETLSLSKENLDGSDTWSVKLKVSDFKVVNDIEAFIEVEYQNGLQRKDDIELFIQRVQYEINKNSAKNLVKS